jgi:hypothetical protein
MEGTLELPSIYAAQGLGKKTSAAYGGESLFTQPH